MSESTPIVQELRIERYTISIILGHHAWEKERARAVVINVTLRWSEEPCACRTDALSDTLCYETLLKRVEASFSGKAFSLIERLTTHIYDVIREFVGEDVALRVEVEKPRPLKADLESVSFVRSDW